MRRVPTNRKLYTLFGLVVCLTLLISGLPAGAQGLTPTNEWVNFYGLETRLNGASVPVGATITAYDPQGVLVGTFVVHTAGQYGVMPVYRDDPMTAGDEGAQPGDTISFAINGQPATPLGPGAPTWTANGDVVQVNLSAGGAPAATNTFTPVPPTNTSVPAATDTPTTAPAASTATATTVAPGATATSPTGGAPEWVNFYGVMSTFDGAPLPAGAIVEAWSTDGVRCGSYTVNTAAQYGVLACQRSAAGQPGVQPGQTVHFTINGRAARPFGPDNAVWTNHGDRLHVELEVPPADDATATPPSATATPGATGTAPEWVNFYGVSTTLDGAPVPVGSLIEAFAGAAKCGQFTVNTAGQYGVLPCYRGTPGPQPNDPITFKINGRDAIASGPDQAIWTHQGAVLHVELSVGAAQAPTATATRTPGGSDAPQWVNFYGIASTYENAPLPVGSVVVAWSPDGVQCGSTTVTVAGSYGLLACMASPVGLPGAHPGDAIYFTINGRAALARGPETAEWTTNGDLLHVELEIPVGAGTPTSTTVPGATATPTATTAPGTATSTPTADERCVGTNYTVKWGDWLYKIARNFGVSVADILFCNPLPNPNLLRPGQVLLIPGASTGPTATPTATRTTPTPPPGGTVYIVRPGDTLSAIAWRYGTTIRAIMNANGLVNANYIYVGQRLVIPTGGTTTPTPTPTTTTPPAGRTYVVKYGDSLWLISLKYQVSWPSIAVANNLYWPYIIYPGQVLKIP